MGADGFDLLFERVGQRAWQRFDARGNGCGLIGWQGVASKQGNNCAAIRQRAKLLGSLLALQRVRQAQGVGGD